MIQSLAYVAYPVADLRKARAFYEGLLGLKVTSDCNGEWLEYDLGDTTFVISIMAALQAPPVRGAVVAFEVDDFDKVVGQLRAGGARFRREPFETPVCRMALVGDPDDNPILIHKRKG